MTIGSDTYASPSPFSAIFWKSQNGKQGGDPAKLALALLRIAAESTPPLRFIAGADSIGTAEQTIATLQKQIDAFRELSSSLALDEETK